MAYEKRELLLIGGVLFFMIGLLGTGLPLIYAVVIAVAIYVGIKAYVGRRKKTLARDVGKGVCVDCGSKVDGDRCPNCDAGLSGDN